MQQLEHCIVIGGGVTGMSAGIMLAREGVHVTLVEQQPRPATLLRGFSRGGLHFDTGFHFAGGLEPGGLLRVWMRVIDLRLPDEDMRVAREIVCLDRRRQEIPSGRQALLNWTATYYPRSLPGMERLVAEVEAVFARSPFTCAAQLGRPEFFQVRDMESVADHLDGLSLDAELKDLLKARCLLYGVHPRHGAWEDYALVAGTYLFSSTVPAGGGMALAQAWEESMERAGVHLVLGRAVCQVLLGEEDGRRRVAGVLLEDGTRLAADGVLLTGHPSQLVGLLPAGALRPAFLRRVASMPETGLPIAVYGAADDALPELSCWYRQTGEDSFHTLDNPNPTLFVMTGEAMPDGRRTCIATALTSVDMDRSDRGYAARRAELGARVASAAERLLPELAGHWQVLDISTPATMRRWLHGSTGSIYGMLHDRHTLPLPPVTRISGFFLAGQSILLPGILGCLVSAAVAATFILGSDIILDRFRTCAHEGTPQEDDTRQVRRNAGSS